MRAPLPRKGPGPQKHRRWANGVLQVSAHWLPSGQGFRRIVAARLAHWKYPRTLPGGIGRGGLHETPVLRRTLDRAATGESSPARGTQDSQPTADGQCVGAAYSLPYSHARCVLPRGPPQFSVSYQYVRFELRPRLCEALAGTVLIARQEEEIHEPTRRRAT